MTVFFICLGLGYCAKPSITAARAEFFGIARKRDNQGREASEVGGACFAFLECPFSRFLAILVLGANLI